MNLYGQFFGRNFKIFQKNGKNIQIHIHFFRGGLFKSLCFRQGAHFFAIIDEDF